MVVEKKQHGWLKEELGNLENLEISDQTSMSRTFCQQECMLDLMMTGWLDPNWILLSSLERAKRAAINMKKDLNHLPTKSNPNLWGAMWWVLQKIYTLTPDALVRFRFHSKKVWSHITSPTNILVGKKKHPPQFFVALDPPNLRVPKISFPSRWGGEKNFPLPTTSVLCHWRMGPSLPGRKKSGSVRAMTTVASVMSSGSWNSNGI